MRAELQSRAIRSAAKRHPPAPVQSTAARPPAVPGLEDALSILDLFTATRRAFTHVEIARETGMSESLVSATLEELRQRGLIESHGPAGELWTAGLRMLELAYAHRMESPLVAASLPVLGHLRSVMNETVMVAVRWGDHRVNVAQLISGQRLHQDIPEGLRKPLYIGAGGKILLAAMSDDAIASYLSRVPLKRCSLTTTTDRDQLIETLLKIRESGFAETFSERNSGGASFGRCVRGPGGQVIAALVISMPLYRYRQDQLEQIRQLLLDGAEEIRERLARSPPSGAMHGEA